MKPAIAQSTLAIMIAASASSTLTSATTTTCRNTAAYGSLDQGCSNDKKICIDSTTGTEPGFMVYGDECAPCINVYPTGGQTDFGCPSSKPRCMTASGTADAPLGNTGGQCCGADGNCGGTTTGTTCPCDVTGSWINQYKNGKQNLLDSFGDQSICYHTPDPLNILLYNLEGTGAVFYAADIDQYHCESTGVTGPTIITHAEAMVCAAILEVGMVEEGIDPPTECPPPVCPCNVAGTWWEAFMQGRTLLTNMPNDSQCYSSSSEVKIQLANVDGSGSVKLRTDTQEWYCDSSGIGPYTYKVISEAEAKSCARDVHRTLGADSSKCIDW